MTSSHQHTSPNQFWKNPLVIVALIVIGYWLFAYHSQHLLGWLPYAIILLCPLMHIFMHGGHGHGGSDHQHHHKTEDKED